MAVRIVIAVLILATVGGVALVMRRRPPEPRHATCTRCRSNSTGPTSRGPEAAWLVTLFSSAACDSCQGLDAKLEPLASSDVGDLRRRRGALRRAPSSLRARRHPHHGHRRPRRCRAASVRGRVHRHRPLGRGRRVARPRQLAPNPTSGLCRRRSGAGRPPVHASAGGRSGVDHQSRLLDVVRQGVAVAGGLDDLFAAVGPQGTARTAGLVAHGVVDEVGDLLAVERLVVEQRLGDRVETGAVLGERGCGCASPRRGGSARPLRR